MKWANAATTVYDTAVEIREIMLGGGTLLDVFCVMLKGVVVGFMVDGMCGSAMGIVLKPLLAVLGAAEQAKQIQEAIKSGDPVRIVVAIVETFCLIYGMTSQCFTGDTLVSTEDGLRPIEEIQAGDYVWSENTETGEKELRKVLSVSVTETDTLVHVTTENGTEIRTTENHPFIVMPCSSGALPAQIVSRSELSYDLLPRGRKRLVCGIRAGNRRCTPYTGWQDGNSCQC